MKRTMSFYLWVVVILGVLEFASEIILQSAPQALHNTSIVLYILAGIATFMVGRKARQERGNPMAAGAALGSVFGVFIGLAPFFIHVTAAELQSRIPQHLSAAKLQQGVAQVNASSTHIAGLVTGVFMLAIIGFIISFIGSAVTARPPVPPEEKQAAAKTPSGSDGKAGTNAQMAVSSQSGKESDQGGQESRTDS